MKLLRIEKAKAKNKKFSAIFEVDGKEKKINFGDNRYRDFTLMNNPKSKYYEPDVKKRNMIKDRYQKRHRRYLSTANNPKGLGSAALSFYILWSAPTVKGGIAKFRSIYFSSSNK